MGTSTQEDWLGRVVDGYAITNILGRGAFSVVYEGVHEKTAKRFAFKSARSKAAGKDATPDVDHDASTAIEPVAIVDARPHHSLNDQPDDGFLPAQGLEIISGGILDVSPSPSLVLKKQHTRLRSLNDPGIVRAEEFVEKDGSTYYRMEVVDGINLRNQIRNRTASPSILFPLARTLDRLQSVHVFGAHGDIKPENIVTTADSVKLLDPGHSPDDDLPCWITTPAYYPDLSGDDLLALGIVAWEIFCHVHPLRELQSNQQRVGPRLQAELRNRELTGDHLLSGLRHLRWPTEANPELPTHAEEFLLRGLGLHRTADNALERGPSFGSFAEYSAALQFFSREFPIFFGQSNRPERI